FEKQIIRLNQQKFHTISQTERNRLLQLQGQIQESSHQNDIRLALYNYHFWLNEQSSLVAAEVRDLSDPDQKLDRIRTEVRKQFLPRFAQQLPREDLNTVFLGLVYLLEQERAAIDSTFNQLFDNLDQLQIRLDAARKFEGDDKKFRLMVTNPDFQSFLRGLKLLRIFERDPEVIDQIISDDLATTIKSTLLSDPARNLLELANNLTGQIHGGTHTSEAQLLTRWMLLAFEDHFSNSPVDLNSFYKSLSPEQREHLENQFPEDRERMLNEMWEQKYGGSQNG
ncbi:MAG: hypothetical protein AAGA30_08320, partial [Planctomycetota bacterium]